MGKTPCCDKNGLKKGPWTAEEDQKLLDYIEKHGHGRWRTLPKNAGLQRCGKSCRLRWTNYLRPDIKRGKFSLEEEDTIIQLHSILGNKWSAIASRLPGRTDNEIKNYWNTHIRKRLLRMGIDPVTHGPRMDFLELSAAIMDPLSHHHHHHHLAEAIIDHNGRQPNTYSARPIIADPNLLDLASTAAAALMSSSHHCNFPQQQYHHQLHDCQESQIHEFSETQFQPPLIQDLQDRSCQSQLVLQGNADGINPAGGNYTFYGNHHGHYFPGMWMGSALSDTTSSSSMNSTAAAAAEPATAYVNGNVTEDDRDSNCVNGMTMFDAHVLSRRRHRCHQQQQEEEDQQLCFDFNRFM